MNIALIGSGGREHALCQKIYQSKLSKNIICIPGNAGTSTIAKNININFLNFKNLLRTIKSNKIDLVIVGPEEPLVKGLVDFLNKSKIKVFGPNKYAAKLEGSKAFMKSICKKYKIPTAQFKICTNRKSVNNFLKTCKMPLVVKADGLAAGKGVAICKSKKQVISFSNEIFQGKNNDFSIAVCLNAAAGLIVAEKSNNFKEAYEKLRKHILSGNVIKHILKMSK